MQRRLATAVYSSTSLSLKTRLAACIVDLVGRLYLWHRGQLLSAKDECIGTWGDEPIQYCFHHRLVSAIFPLGFDEIEIHQRHL